HIFATGLSALPIVATSAFLIGVVIAFQSLVQLQKFGADIFIVDTIGISLTRELAPLVTAIVVAGRSGSAFTAQIGAMKMTQEIDAMKTMGFDPFIFLVWPRVIALMVVMPLLIFFADIVGIFGGMVVAQAQAGLSFDEFLYRLKGALALKHYVIGIIKGPFFAFLIALISTYRGFQVSLNTESIGHYTTQSVVNSIFLVIACDALFSILLTELKL
ncbi:MAG TPA: ABC transporter permease, partial [Sulfuricurvum sp.]|nr:ABC transporter permease [Sulfuricurvum sp.]